MPTQFSLKEAKQRRKAHRPEGVQRSPRKSTPIAAESEDSFDDLPDPSNAPHKSASGRGDKRMKSDATYRQVTGFFGLVEGTLGKVFGIVRGILGPVFSVALQVALGTLSAFVPYIIAAAVVGHGGAYLSPKLCATLAAEEQQNLQDTVELITKSTYETVDQGQQLVIRTHGLPEPKSLALRSTNLHSLQWAVLYHTNFTDRVKVADGLRAASHALEGTVDALIELKGDAEYALRDMVDQFERIERALDATLLGRKSLKDLEDTFDDSLKSTDDMLGRLQVDAVNTSQLAKKTKSEVEQVRRVLSIQKRDVDQQSEKIAPPILDLFCADCLSKAQKRQLKQDLVVYDECNSEMKGLTQDLAGLGVELGQFRHNVKLVRSSWRRVGYVRGDVKDQIETLRGKVEQLKAMMEGRKAAEALKIEIVKKVQV
ncbi:uncharacterized protein EV422DRAFT_566269 [Fimicolochytrium jonesii]|uniref:uncharacterized protein n=1 Tax=Fimicolochytrium jonesii TaxID=1396493 RepID=UPI0022FDD14B|nr:uncharacterized protein EV422DRAFT_566269 [Fimicolochytrium jonesii]KAI8822593.1 hypothetical protein EV422DRAFT_566269 [Fimicolochytrium jonesii]